MMKRLKCDSVVRALDLPDAFTALKVDTPILAMEFCSGGDLRKVLNKPVSTANNYSLYPQDFLPYQKNISLFTFFPIFWAIHNNSTTAVASRRRKFDRFSSR